MTLARRLAVSLVASLSAGALAAVVTAKDAAAPPPSPAAAQPASAETPLIQMAILLDTSGSMEGLIDQARSRLWAVVNELATTKRDGQTPRFEVALYEYGKSSLPAQEGYLRMILPLTDDLDAVSEKLFALDTNGGDEYCGWAIKSAAEGLRWSDDRDAYKVIFIAGNEPFSQGPVDFRTSCSAAIGRGIMVNTIHCGSEDEGVRSGWRDGAALADGTFLNIDQNTAVVAIAAPQDAEIARLSTTLNDTYLPFGARGFALAERQVAQDAAAASQPAALAAGAPVQRAVAKSSSFYRNASWDLVDAVEEGKKLEDLKDEELPVAMRGMTPEQRKAHVEAQAKKRAEIQQKIQSLNTDRETFVAARRAEQAAQAGTTSLDAAMITAVREQLTEKQFDVKK